MKRVPIWLKAFLINSIIGICIIAPFVIKGNGYFTLSNDFNAQEISFNIFMNQAVKSGELLWNTGIDIGSNFIESFGFYNLGSPFVWLSLLFPASAIPKVIPWMFVLKFAVAGTASALYFKRHSRNELAIMLGSILYAFSGYQCSSMLFYHFQDMVALFPFLMIGLEKLVEEQKKGCLALACAFNCFTNLVFFVGDVLFLILYFVIRYLIPACVSKDRKNIRKTLTDILCCMCEGAVGFLISGIITIPVMNGLLNVPRTAQHLVPKDWISISSAAILTSLKAFFLPGELMSCPSSVWENDWMTNAAYLPLFGVVFVIAYCIKKRDWLSQLIKTCIIISLIPVLNNTFAMASDSPYRRWYYMLILFMVLATMKVMEQPKDYPVKKGAIVSLLAIGCFVVFTLIMPWSNETESVIFDPVIYWYMILISVVGIGLSVWYLKCSRREIFLCLAGCFAIITMSVNIARSQNYMDDSHLKFKELSEEGNYSQSEGVITYLTEFPETLEAHVAPYRYYYDEGIWKTYYNLGMTNALQSTNSFISTVNGSIFRFYDAIGSERQTMSPNEIYGVEELLGAKYLIVSDYLERSQEYADSGENLILQDLAPTDKYADYECIKSYTDQNGFHFYVYDNPYALPIGFSYDAYILESELEQIAPQLRGIVMMQAMVITDEDENTVSDIMQHFDFETYRSASSSMNPEEKQNWTEFQKDEDKNILNEQNVYSQELFCDTINEIALDRQTNACEKFEYGHNSFSAMKVSEKDCYTFFSIPYDRFWHAYVDGKEVQILDCVGLMAVRTEAGAKSIKFVYDYLPIKAGVVSTCMGIVCWIGLELLNRRSKAKLRK